MPELPEVETIRTGLQKKIVGQKIKNTQILNPNSFQGDPKQIIGGKISKVTRRAKMLILELTPPDTPDTLGTPKTLHLVFHLKMSGQVILIDSNKKKSRFVGGHPTTDMLGNLPNKSTRVIFKLENYTLYFNDQRKFGWIKLLNHDSTTLNQLFLKLGPEPLDKSFTWQLLKKQIIKHKSLPIKVAILDQHILSGIGNIYACEALFLAKIHPQTKVQALTDQNVQNLHSGIIESLKNGIKFGGATRTHFVNADGQKGLFLDYAAVYNRQGKNCKVCQAKIEKIKLGGRGTYYCPNCQKEKQK